MADYTILYSSAGSIVTAFVLYLFRRFQENDLIPFAGRDSNRTRVLSTLARVNQPFGVFYKTMRSPEQTLRRGPRDLTLSYLVTTYWWYFPVFPIVMFYALSATDLISPFVTFIGEMEGLVMAVVFLHPSTRLMTRFWSNYGGQGPRRRWAALFANYRFAYDVVWYFVFGILMSFFAVVLRLYLLKEDLSTLVAENIPYSMFAGAVAGVAAILIFRLVYFGGIHTIEDYAFSRHFEGRPVSLELVLADSDKTSEERPQGRITSIGANLTLERQDGFVEEFRWRDIRRIASRLT